MSLFLVNVFSKFSMASCKSAAASAFAAGLFVLLGTACSEQPVPEAKAKADESAEWASVRVELCKNVVAHYGGKHTVDRVEQSVENVDGGSSTGDPYERVALTLAMRNALGTAMAGSASCDYAQTSQGIIARKPYRITIGKTVHDDPASVAEMVEMPEDFGLGEVHHDH